MKSYDNIPIPLSEDQLEYLWHMWDYLDNQAPDLKDEFIDLLTRAKSEHSSFEFYIHSWMSEIPGDDASDDTFEKFNNQQKG